MLVQFTVRNCLSFREETTLDLTAINAYKEHESNLIDIGTKEKFLKVAAIYGANASGKSNLYMAVNFFQKIILESLNNTDDEGNLAIEKYFAPFSFEENTENTEFQIIVIVNDFEYKYGFEYNDTCIVTEWLYRKNLKTNRSSTIFERTTENAEFGASVRKECDVYKEQLPAETLVLSFFNKLKLKTEVFRDVYAAIMSTLVVSTDYFENIRIADALLPNVIDQEKEKLVQFLTAIDTGIADITYDDSDRNMTFFTFHTGKDGSAYSLNLYDESEGTIKSILLFI